MPEINQTNLAIFRAVWKSGIVLETKAVCKYGYDDDKKELFRSLMGKV